MREVVKPGRVVVGSDIRLTSESLKQALSDGLRDSGVDVFDIGLCGTEEIYFATFDAAAMAKKWMAVSRSRRATIPKTTTA